MLVAIEVVELDAARIALRASFKCVWTASGDGKTISSGFDFGDEFVRTSVGLGLDAWELGTATVSPCSAIVQWMLNSDSTEATMIFQQDMKEKLWVSPQDLINDADIKLKRSIHSRRVPFFRHFRLRPLTGILARLLLGLPFLGRRLRRLACALRPWGRANRWGNVNCILLNKLLQLGKCQHHIHCMIHSYQLILR